MIFLQAQFLWLLLPIGVYFMREQQRRTPQQFIRWMAVLLLIIAIARPVVYNGVKEQELPIHSIIIALDLSASMSANDIQPSRAKASRDSIKAFLETNLHDQVALIGFTVNPLLLSPPTTDHHLVSLALDTLKQEYILTKGTDLVKLLEKVAKFSDEEKRLVLFTDGGDEPIASSLALFADEHHISILAIAMGTEQGATIKTKEGALLKNKKGEIIVSTLNSSLSTLAHVVPFESVAKSVESITAWLNGDKEAQNIHKEQRSYHELFWIPTLLALFLLFVSATRFSLHLLALFALMGVNLKANDLASLHQAYNDYERADYNQSLIHLKEIESASLESELALAHTYYKLEEYKKAKSILKSLKSTSPKVKQQLLYELGNCEAKLAYYERAKNYYVQALQLGEDNDTLENLAWVIFQKKVDHSTVGYTNASSPQASTPIGNEEESEESPSEKENEKTGGSGGDGASSAKLSTIKVIKASANPQQKRAMSSRAYDLINEGYIKEEKPW